MNLTPGEWIKGIEFMTKVGQTCTPARQEFILLSDTLGLSALVNGLHDKTAIEEGTHTSLLGPFYRETHADACRPAARSPGHVKPGSECALYGRITDVNGKPLANATVSVWQTGADGLYDIQESADRRRLSRRVHAPMPTASMLRTVKPRRLLDPDGRPGRRLVKAQGRHGMRPAHIHFLVGAPGYRELVTALYLRDDPHLADDVVFGSSDDLAVDIVANDPDSPIKGLPSIRFDLQAGARERSRQDQRARRLRSGGDHEGRDESCCTGARGKLSRWADTISNDNKQHQ